MSSMLNWTLYLPSLSLILLLKVLHWFFKIICKKYVWYLKKRWHHSMESECSVHDSFFTWKFCLTSVQIICRLMPCWWLQASLSSLSLTRTEQRTTNPMTSSLKRLSSMMPQWVPEIFWLVPPHKKKLVRLVICLCCLENIISMKHCHSPEGYN